jgi:hypothetical protein
MNIYHLYYHVLNLKTTIQLHSDLQLSQKLKTMFIKNQNFTLTLNYIVTCHQYKLFNI